MKTAHLVTLFATDPIDPDRELTLTATVSLIPGTRDELEVEWTESDESDLFVSDFIDRTTEKALEQRAREAWYDVMQRLDQPTEEDERGYWEQRREDNYGA